MLVGLLLILALRLTMTETIREPLGRKMADFAAKAAGKGTEVRVVGPEVTAWLATATLALVAVSAGLGAMAGCITRNRLGKFALIGLILALAMMSTIHASNRFASLIGTADLAMALTAGWAIAVLCDSRLLGDHARRIVIAAIVAILATWAAKGLYQRFVEFPETLTFFEEHRDEQLAARGVDPNDSYYTQLFVSRLHGMEVSGFVSLSNVMAAGLIGLVTVLTGLLAASFVPPPPPLSPSPPPPSPSPSNVPVKAVLQIVGGVLVAVGMLVGVLTKSRGGSTLTIACPLIFAAAVVCRKQVWAWRKGLIVAAVAVGVLVAAAVVSYGKVYDRLPSKSLTFRWHYWTGAAKLVMLKPMWGVGLNNFSEYYGSVKRPSSPEDVSDPHSFFVRLAAELGVPATLLMAALLVWIFATSLRKKPEVRSQKPEAEGLGVPWLRTFVVVLILSLIWWVVHNWVAETAAEFYLYLAVIAAVIAAGAATGAMGLAEEMPPHVLRMVSLAALLGALGMLAYDQINMAIVTGPVAMLFWMLLGLADSHEVSPALGSAGGLPHDHLAVPSVQTAQVCELRRPVAPNIPAIVCGAAAVIMAIWVALPLMHGTMIWNPEQAEMRYVATTAGGSPEAAFAAINEAAALSPRTMEILRARMELKLRMHPPLPVADDIRQMLALDKANARIRISLASLETDLPMAERIAMLREALQLDAQLPPDEIKRLSDQKKTEVNSLIEQLSQQLKTN